MRLEIGFIEIKDIQFARETTINNETLYINRQELIALLKNDRRFDSVEVEIAKPGEDTRIVRIFDIIEPRAKLKESGQDFPGIIGKFETAGKGQSRAIKGSSVIVIDQLLDGFGTVVDMAGPGADFGLYGKILNVVINPSPSTGVTKDDYHAALRLAGLRAAVYLARAKQEIPNTHVKTYELTPPNSYHDKSIPKIGYLFQIFSQQYQTLDSEPVLYGGSAVGMLPTILHPNEIIDGALIKSYAETGFETYNIQNNQVIMQLYRRNLKDLLFSGVVISNSSIKEPERERNALIAANLFSSALNVDGVVMTKTFGGASNIDLEKLAEKLKEIGIDAVPIVQVVAWESNLKDTLLFNTSSLDAVVCSGWIHEPTTLPRMEKIIGGSPNLEAGEVPVDAEIRIERRYIRGAVNNLGCSKLKVDQY